MSMKIKVLKVAIGPGGICMSPPLDRVKAHTATAGNVWSRLVDARRRSSRTTVGAPLLYWQHRSVAGKPYISVSIDPRWRTVGWRFSPRTLGQQLLRSRRPLRSRPGMASVIWESLVYIGGCSWKEFADSHFALLCTASSQCARLDEGPSGLTLCCTCLIQ